MKPLRILILIMLFPLCLYSQEKQIAYRNLVMEGGGIKGIAYGGALKELETRGIMEGIVRVAGTSAGAIQASLVAVGYSAEEITNIVTNTPIEAFNDDGFLTKGSRRLVKKFGWFQGDSFLEKMESLVHLRTGNANLTFAQLHGLAKTYPFRDLYVTGCNLTEQQVEVFSYETYPNMRIVDAVRISMSIPLYYRAVWLNKEGMVIEDPKPADNCRLFVDGGLLLNYPVEVFDNTKYVSNYEGDEEKPIFNEETIGFRLERCEQIDHEIGENIGLASFQIDDFGSYMSALSNLLMRNVHPPHPRDHERTVFINDMGISARVRRVPEDEKTIMMLSGQHGVTEFFRRLP